MLLSDCGERYSDEIWDAHLYHHELLTSQWYRISQSDERLKMAKTYSDPRQLFDQQMKRVGSSLRNDKDCHALKWLAVGAQA